MVDLLLVVPHPDDEVFGAGGTLIEYRRRGLFTGLITLTRGDKGRDLGLATEKPLPELREEELRKAAEILQIGHLEIHQYPDQGVGQHPEIVDLLADRFNNLKPRAIITFPPNGVNRHVDHVATHYWVKRALEKSGHPTRLFYYSAPNPPAEFRDGWLPPTHRRDLALDVFGQKIKAMAQHRTQALTVLRFMERFAGRLWSETFHLEGYEGPVQSELL